MTGSARSVAALSGLVVALACSSSAHSPAAGAAGNAGAIGADAGSTNNGGDGSVGSAGANAATAGASVAAGAGGRMAANGGGGAGTSSGAAGAAPSTTVMLTETAEAFRNPMKGFRPSRYIQDTAFKSDEYASTYKHYVPYSSLESSASDSAQKIKDWSDTSWSDLRARNLKVIPRVVISYPGTGEFWGDLPHDGTPNQWNTPALSARLSAFVAKLGQAWDNDPRVAAVEMGLWGKWGEQNIYPDTVNGSDRMPVALQQVLGDAFSAAFKNKKVMVRYPNAFEGYKTFGFYWDSFALPDDDNAAGGAGIVARDLWRTQMQSGEVAYDWGNQAMLGGTPNGTLSSNANTDYVIGYIRKLHASSLGWIAEYTPDNGAVSGNAAKMQKALGYRFAIEQATFSVALGAGAALDLSLVVANVGSAPFYYDWPVEVSLLDAKRAVAWSGVLSSAHLTEWLPGASVTVHGSFLPQVPNGTYTVAVAVLDPAGDRPSLRFANTNYYHGGRTPLGKLGVGMMPADQALKPFDELKADESLAY